MSLKKFVYKYNNMRKKMGSRVLFYVFLSIFAALAGRFLGPYIPQAVVDNLGKLDVQPVLSSLSGTMLTISTFSLSIVVSANYNAVSATTPRAFSLLVDDQGTQDMLSRFIGAFVFSTIALMVLPLGYYGGGGRIILLAFTLWIVILIIVNFVRWVMVIRKLGSMSYALGRISGSTEISMKDYFKDMLSGCNWFKEDTLENVEGVQAVYSGKGQYIQLIDESGLQNTASENDLWIYINQNEGDFVSMFQPLVYVVGELNSHVEKEIASAFYFGEGRDIAGDPRFGFTMLYQTASKALSPGINDPGTAVACIHTAYPLMSKWRDVQEINARYNRVWKKPIDFERLLDEFFEPIVHDAGDFLSVQKTVLETLGALNHSSVKTVSEAADVVGLNCYKRAMNLLQDQLDKDRLRASFRETSL